MRSAPLKAQQDQSQVVHLVRALEALSVTLALGAHAGAIAASQGRLPLPARFQATRQTREQLQQQQQRQLVVSELAGGGAPVHSTTPLGLGHQLWLTLPLLAAYLFHKLHSFLSRQDRRHDPQGGLDVAAAARLLRLELVAGEQQQSLAGMGRQVEKLRGRVRLVSQDLTLPLKEEELTAGEGRNGGPLVQQGAAQQAELLAGLAGKLQQAERDIRDNQDLLVAMQGLSSKQFDLILKVIKQQEEQARQLARDQRQDKQAAAKVTGGTATPAPAPSGAAAAPGAKSRGGGGTDLSRHGAQGTGTEGRSGSMAAGVGGGRGEQPSKARLTSNGSSGGNSNITGGGGSGSNGTEVDEWGRRVVAPPTSSVSSKLIRAAVSTLSPPAQQAEQPQQQGSAGAVGGAPPPATPAGAVRGPGPEQQAQQEKVQQQQQQQQQPMPGRPGGLSSTISKILDQDPYFKAEQQMYSALTLRLPGAPSSSSSDGSSSEDTEGDSIQGSGDWWGGGGSGSSRGPPGSGAPGPTGGADLAADATNVEGYSAPDPQVVERLLRLLQADGGAGSKSSEGGGAALFERGPGQRRQQQQPGLGGEGLAGGSAAGGLEGQAETLPNSQTNGDSLSLGGSTALPESRPQDQTWQARPTAVTAAGPARPAGAAAVHAAPCDGRMTAQGGVGQVAWRAVAPLPPLSAGRSDGVVTTSEGSPGALGLRLQQEPHEQQHGLEYRLEKRQQEQQQRQEGHGLKLRLEHRAGRIVVHHPFGGSAIYEERDDGSVVFSFSQEDGA
ncbi:hypothetical protein N2152v2_008359 [Parachlorella kessleri]